MNKESYVKWKGLWRGKNRFLAVKRRKEKVKWKVTNTIKKKGNKERRKK